MIVERLIYHAELTHRVFRWALPALCFVGAVLFAALRPVALAKNGLFWFCILGGLLYLLVVLRYFVFKIVVARDSLQLCTYLKTVSYADSDIRGVVVRQNKARVPPRLDDILIYLRSRREPIYLEDIFTNGRAEGAAQQEIPSLQTLLIAKYGELGKRNEQERAQ